MFSYKKKITLCHIGAFYDSLYGMSFLITQSGIVAYNCLMFLVLEQMNDRFIDNPTAFLFFLLPLPDAPGINFVY